MVSSLYRIGLLIQQIIQIASPLLFLQVKEKTIAARRSEVKTIIFPSANRRDFDELASNVKEGLDVHFVDEYSQIFNLAFEDKSE